MNLERLNCGQFSLSVFLAFFDDFKLGVVKDDAIHDVSAVVRDIPHIGPGDLINGLIEHFARSAESVCFGVVLIRELPRQEPVLGDDRRHAVEKFGIS